MMMSKVRGRFWVRTLRTVLKKIKGRCGRCKVMAAELFPVPTARQLPQSRGTANCRFRVLWVDFEGPFQSTGDDEKAYVINFSCGISKAVYRRGLALKKGPGAFRQGPPSCCQSADWPIREQNRKRNKKELINCERISLALSLKCRVLISQTWIQKYCATCFFMAFLI